MELKSCLLGRDTGGGRGGGPMPWHPFKWMAGAEWGEAGTQRSKSLTTQQLSSRLQGMHIKIETQ